MYRRKVFPDQYLTTGRLPRATLRASHASGCAAQSREPNWSEDARRFPEFPKSCASCLKLIARNTSSWSGVLESTNKTAAGCSVDMTRPIDAPSKTMTPGGEASIRTTAIRISTVLGNMDIDPLGSRVSSTSCTCSRAISVNNFQLPETRRWTCMSDHMNDAAVWRREGKWHPANRPLRAPCSVALRAQRASARDTSQTSSYTSHHQSSWMTDVIRRSLRERHTHPGSPKMDRI